MGVRSSLQDLVLTDALPAFCDWADEPGAGDVMRDAFTRRWYFVATIIGGIFFSASSSTATAADLEDLAQRVGIRVLAEPTSDAYAMNNGRQQIPYGKMSKGAQQRAADLIAQTSQYRRMPCLQYEVDPNIYQYLINHPDVAIATWRAMGISKLQMRQTDAFSYEADAADGSEGTADILWRDGNQCLFMVQGTYKSPILPNPIRASALVWLRYRFVKAHDGATLVNQQVETFIHFPSSAIDTIARLASRVTNAILDRNVFEVSLYARMMSRASKTEPEWLEQLAYRMDGVPSQRRMEMIEIARGRKSSKGQMLPVASGKVIEKPEKISRSGAFSEFETSMLEVNVHAPLTLDEVEHKPSYGKKIGAGNSYMATPHRYMPAEAVEAIREQEKRNERTQAYNNFYAVPEAKGAPEIVEPQAIPPSSDDSMHPRQAPVADLMKTAPPIVFSRPARRNDDARKATSGSRLVPKPSGRVRKNASSQNASGKMRSVSSPRTVPPVPSPRASSKAGTASESPQPAQLEEVPLLAPED